MDMTNVIESIDNWAVLRTAARWEKAVAEQLMLIGIPIYLPLMTRISRSKSKTQSAKVPLFPGYVFCAEQDFRDSKQISWSCRQKIAQLLRSPDPARLKAELSGVADLLQNRQLIQERYYGTIGDTVRVTGGPFNGHLGTILRLKPGTSRLILEISFLGSQVEAVIEEQMVEKVRSPKPTTTPSKGRSDKSSHKRYR